MSGRADSTTTPSSSRSSRASASTGASPTSHLPPGNSHRPARCLPAGRRASSTRPPASRNTPATTWTEAGTAGSDELAVTLLVLLARPAWTRVVAPDLRRLAQLRHADARHRCVVRFRRLLAGAEAGRLRVLELHRARLHFGLAALLLFHRLDFLLAADAHAREQLHDLELDAAEHAFEQLERFAL